MSQVYFAGTWVESKFKRTPDGINHHFALAMSSHMGCEPGVEKQGNEKQDGGRSEGWSWHSRQLNAIMALIIVERWHAGIVLSVFALRWPCWIHPSVALSFPLYAHRDCGNKRQLNGRNDARSFDEFF